MLDLLATFPCVDKSFQWKTTNDRRYSFNLNSIAWSLGNKLLVVWMMIWRLVIQASGQCIMFLYLSKQPSDIYKWKNCNNIEKLKLRIKHNVHMLTYTFQDKTMKNLTKQPLHTGQWIWVFSACLISDLKIEKYSKYLEQISK